MKLEVTKLNINNEMDVVLAHRRAMQIAKFSGISLSEQTRFATAVSEICRNCLEYAKEGVIIFSVMPYEDRYQVEAEISDRGKGIQQLTKILERNPSFHKGRGLGIVFAKRLSDNFEIRSTTSGTQVRIRKLFAPKVAIISKLVIEGWKKHMQDEPALSAYEELKIRNNQLLELTDELTAQKKKSEEQVEQIAQLNTRLQQSNTNMKEFTYAVSHDLKTPLTSLKLSLGLLSSGDDASKHLPMLNRSVLRLDKTIKGLIDILDIQNPASHVIKKVNVVQILSDVQEDLKPQLESVNGTIASDFSKIQEINYVEAYIKSILTNLITNSYKYRRNVPLEISITAVQLKKGMRLVYRDNGSGIDLSKFGDRLFAPFARLVHTGEGKGIGLYIIKTMVENNGGSVKVESTVGEGTTFSFDLVGYSG